MEVCCSCHQSVASGQMKTKRRKLVGTSCEVEMRLMQRLVSELEGKGASGLMTGLTTAMGPLCMHCRGQLDNWRT